jgi:hypothetical protein
LAVSISKCELVAYLAGELADIGVVDPSTPPGEVIERAVFSCSVEHPRRD